MNRKKKIVRNIMILTVLLFIYVNRFGLYFTPISAHEHSERSILYGPSKVIHIEDIKGGKLILCKYDKWLSCNTVNRRLLFFWGMGNQVTGFENDTAKAISYTWAYFKPNYKVYGIVNDNKVKKVEVTLGNGEVFTQTEFYEDLFLFSWDDDVKEEISTKLYFKKIVGYDSEGIMIFQDEL